MPTDTEDPNIATLRRWIREQQQDPESDVKARDALSALASTLAEAKTIAATAEAWERNVEHLTAKYEELEATLAERDAELVRCADRIRKLTNTASKATVSLRGEEVETDDLREALAERDRRIAELNAPTPAHKPEPVEPSDDALFKIETAAVREVLRSGDHSHRAQNKAVRRALYRAGLAAEAAAHEKARVAWSNQAHEADGQRMQLRAELERVRAELASCESERRYSNGWLSYLAERCGLDVLRTVTSEALVKGVVAELRELRAQARARRVPTDAQLQEALSRVLKGYGAEVTASILVDMADAVLRLFAEAPTVDDATHGVASPPKRFASADEALSCLRETIAEECHQEHPAHDAIEVLQRAAEPTPWKPTVGERAVLVALKDAENALTGRVTELERRMTRRQKQAHETNDRLARLERDSHAPVNFTDIFDALTRRVEALEVAYGTIIAKQDEMESRVSGLNFRP